MMKKKYTVTLLISVAVALMAWKIKKDIEEVEKLETPSFLEKKEIKHTAKNSRLKSYIHRIMKNLKLR